MHTRITTAQLLSIFALDEEQMARREKAGAYIHSFAAMIGERMYRHYLLKDPEYQNVLSTTDVPRLIRMFSDYFGALFMDPIDERLIERTLQIGQVHRAIGLEPIHVARGFDVLNEIIIDLAAVNTQIREDLAVILKMLRISETVMNESYYQIFTEHQQELKKENEVLSLFDKLYAALTVHKQTQRTLTQWWEDSGGAEGRPEHMAEEQACPFTRFLDEIRNKETLLKGFNIDVDEISRLHSLYHRLIGELFNADEAQKDERYREIQEVSSAMYGIIDQPLEEISASSYLGVHSGIEFLQVCADSIYEKGGIRENGEMFEQMLVRLKESFANILGWCIDELYIGGEDVCEEHYYDIREKIVLKNERMNIAVLLKEIPNKVYMIEIIKILVEIVRQNFHNRERESALIQLVDQVERASQSKDMFLANMSHELRTPLNAIIGFSQILMMNKSLPENLHPYIQKISVAGNNLLALVNTILDFAKLEAGKLTFKPEMTLISTLVRDVAGIIEPMAQKKSLRFTHPEMISLGLYLDRQLIQQVLLNLLSNAVKFTPEGGEVSIVIEFDEEKRHYRFGVCDTGVGIEAKDMAMLFDPFTQVENPFQKASKGTGLGLAISKRIIEDLHGGSLWVESESGKGSCFYFTIPIAQSQNTLERFVSENPSAMRVLVVEDASEYQKMLVERLSGEYHLSVTNSVNRAKELIENEPFDMLILDFFLVDGISSEVLQFMELNRITIPAIIISAEDDSKLINHLPASENVEGIFNKTHIYEICDYLTKRSGGPQC